VFLVNIDDDDDDDDDDESNNSEVEISLYTYHFPGTNDVPSRILNSGTYIVTNELTYFMQWTLLLCEEAVVIQDVFYTNVLWSQKSKLEETDLCSQTVLLDRDDG
jgi:hypothetical protein